jgi:septal ring factor EnvC (AmiA/AmiB activator)
MNVLLSFFLLASMAAAPAWALDKEAEIQVLRLDEALRHVREENEQLTKDIRELQRAFADMQKEQAALNRKLESLLDALAKTENTDITNLKAGLQKLYDDYPQLNWGREKRDCDTLASHQQIRITQSPDGTYSLRYLCFDGQLLHIGTEVHQPPVE